MDIEIKQKKTLLRKQGTYLKAIRLMQQVLSQVLYPLGIDTAKVGAFRNIFANFRKKYEKAFHFPPLYITKTAYLFIRIKINN